MPSFTANVLYLGNFADGLPNLDPNGTGSAENASALVGETFTQASNVSVTVNDANNDSFAEFDGGAGGDNITFDLGQGAGSQTENVNQGVWYDIRIVLDDASVINTDASIFQTSGGETFLTEFTTSLDNLSIQSIEVTGVINNMFSRIGIRDVSGTTVCFVEGTMIDTPGGPCAIEALTIGDLVHTLDAGALPVTAILTSACSHDENRVPVQFSAGSIGPGAPHANLNLSPQHRILCASALVERMFGCPEVLIPAKRFVGLPGIRHNKRHDFSRYIHIELAKHAVISANGAYVESCLMAEETRKAMPMMVRGLYLAQPIPAPCRLVPSGQRQKGFVARLARSQNPINGATRAAKITSAC